MKMIKHIKTIKRKLEKLYESILSTSYNMELYNYKYMLLERSINSNSSLCSESSEFIVSLTTYGKRTWDVHLVIESLACQTLKPKFICLVLDANEFPLDNDLPIQLLNLKSRGLKILRYHNVKSYKKIVPALNLFGDDFDIITADDDILYPIDFCELLVSQSRLNRDSAIFGHRCHGITRNYDKKANPYNKWLYEELPVNSQDVFLTTGSGVLFPKELNAQIFLDEDIFMKLCPNADDIWINYIASINNISRVRIEKYRDFSKEFFILPNNQDTSLLYANVHNDGNDNQLINLERHYGQKF